MACHSAACTDDRARRMGLIFTTADWRGQICDGFRQPRIRPAQRSTQRSVGTVSLSSCVPRRWWVEDRALWHHAVLDVAPKGNRELARNGDDHNLPHVATARSRDPLAALFRAAVVGAWGKAQKASDLPPVGELAVINFTRKQG